MQNVQPVFKMHVVHKGAKTVKLKSIENDRLH